MVCSLGLGVSLTSLDDRREGKKQTSELSVSLLLVRMSVQFSSEAVTLEEIK